MLDYKNAFGQSDKAFENAVHSTLDKLCNSEQAVRIKPRLSKMAVITAVIAIIIMLSATAVAVFYRGLFGIPDFFDIMHRDFPEEAEEFIDTHIPEDAFTIIDVYDETTGNIVSITFTVTETIFDGVQFHAAVTAIVPDGYFPVIMNISDPYHTIGMYGKEGDTTPIGEYLAEQGLTGLYVTARVPDKKQLVGLYHEFTEDGTVNFGITGHLDEAALQITILCAVSTFFDDGYINANAMVIDEITVDIGKLPIPRESYNLSSIIFDDIGVRFDNVEFCTTYLSAYLTAEFRVFDEILFNAAMSAPDSNTSEYWWRYSAFHILDKHGRELNINIETISVSIEGWEHSLWGSTFDYLPIRFVLRSADSLPEEIMIRPRNIFTQEDYEPVIVILPK